MSRLVVWNMNFIPFSWEFHRPNWQSRIFQRGRYTTNQCHWVSSDTQWVFQDPKMEVLYHIRPYFVRIFPYINLKNRPYICGRYLQFIGSWPAWPLSYWTASGWPSQKSLEKFSRGRAQRKSCLPIWGGFNWAKVLKELPGLVNVYMTMENHHF